MIWAYLSVFGAAFAAATVLPFYSELLVVPLARNTNVNLFWLWLAATSGNTLGALINWFLGRSCLHLQDRKWFPATKKQMHMAQHWFQRWGKWMLLLSWLPIGGDALTLIAGIMRVPIYWFLFLVALGKGIRYIVVIALAINLFQA